MNKKKTSTRLKKNKLYIEKSTGRLKVTIEQKDCYNHHIFLFNLLIGLKNDAKAQITRKTKETAQHKI